MADTNPFARLFSAKPSGTIATLARLAPGKTTDGIEISLATHDPKTSAPYDCISYDRSKKFDDVDITVDGKPMPIPLPLKQALQSLRNPMDSILLWADLLTGNSAEERSKQAQVMKEVVQNARRVTCFLGPGSKRSGEVFSVLQTLANWYRQACLHANFPEKLSMATRRHMEDMQTSLRSRNMTEIRLHDTSLWQEINGVLTSSYFKSAQAITDIILGKEVIVQSGSGSLRWEDLDMALKAVIFVLPSKGVMVPPSIAEYFQIISSIEISVRRAKKSETLELLPMVQSARDCSTSADPRDLVFAMLPIVTPSDRVKGLGNKPEALPVADYTKSSEQVFTEAAKHIIQERQDFLIWWKQVPPCQRKLRDLPSFAPDWSAPLPESTFVPSVENKLRQWSDFVKSPKRIFVDEDSALHVQAHAIDRIQNVSPIFTEKNYRRLVLQMWKSGMRVPGETNQKTLDKFWRALVMDTDAEYGERLRDNKKPSGAMAESFQSLICEEMIMETLGCTVEEFMSSPALQARARADQSCVELSPATGKSEAFCNLLLHNSLGRRLFWTSTGKVGMTAIEGSATGADGDDNSTGPRVPNFDESLNNAMGRSMMDAFHAYLAQRDPAAARVAAQALQGNLPGQRAPGVRSGDIVVALVGGFQPYILRPVLSEQTTGELKADAKYAFVGGCHLQGAMDAECFVDPNDLYGGWKEVPLVDVLIV